MALPFAKKEANSKQTINEFVKSFFFYGNEFYELLR